MYLVVGFHLPPCKSTAEAPFSPCPIWDLKSIIFHGCLKPLPLDSIVK